MTKWARRPRDSPRPSLASPGRRQLKSFPKRDLGNPRAHQGLLDKARGTKTSCNGLFGPHPHVRHVLESTSAIWPPWASVLCRNFGYICRNLRRSLLMASAGLSKTPRRPAVMRGFAEGDSLSFGSGPRQPSDLAGDHPARSSWQGPSTRGRPGFPRQMHSVNSSPWPRSNAPFQSVSRTATPGDMDVIPTDRHPPISPSNRHLGFSHVTTSACRRVLAHPSVSGRREAQASGRQTA